MPPEMSDECERATPAYASAFLDALRTVRFPRLRHTTAHIPAELAELKLRPGFTGVPPKDLNSDVVIRLDVRTSAELARLIAALKDRDAERAQPAEGSRWRR